MTFPLHSIRIFKPIDGCAEIVYSEILFYQTLQMFANKKRRFMPNESEMVFAEQN